MILMPQVSIIIPTFNSVRYVRAAVESVLAQTFQDFQLIVVDDGSTDATHAALAPYSDRLTYIYQENQERSAARNTGLRVATGEYVAFLDADDTWYSDKLERQVSVLAEHPEVVLVYGQAIYMDVDGNDASFRGQHVCGHVAPALQMEDLSRALISGNVVYGGGSMPLVRRSALASAGWFDESLCYPEDWDLWARLSHLGLFAYLPRPLVRYRVYGWDKVLRVEATEELLCQQIRVVERAAAGWEGPAQEREQLRVEGLVAVHLRAALASTQLGRLDQAQSQLARAIAVDPIVGTRQRLIQMAAERAKLIETATGSYEQACVFLDRFFAVLPPGVRQTQAVRREAVGHMYIAGAFEQHAVANQTAVRQLWLKGVIHAPAFLRNAGVWSIGAEAWLGGGWAETLRRVGRNFLFGRTHLSIP